MSSPTRKMKEMGEEGTIKATDSEDIIMVKVGYYTKSGIDITDPLEDASMKR